MSTPEIAIVIPTFNERDNVGELLTRLEKTLAGRRWEAVFVDDDSKDGTVNVIRDLAASRDNVRCVLRIGRRGLSRAVVEGVLATFAPNVVVMDADLQHDESIIPAMLDKLDSQVVDLVVGSRYCEGGGIGNWDATRASMSRFATSISRLIGVHGVTDPMSGFFAFRRDFFLDSVRHLSGEGYKILVDVVASAPKPPRIAEVPYTFRARLHGESKLDSAVMLEFLLLILDKKFGAFVPPRFILFSAVGFLGLIVHFVVMGLAFRALGLDFTWAQGLATGVAMTSNYIVNNLLTYRDKRRRGFKFFTGLLSFYLVCGIGAVSNVGVASFVFHERYTWWLAGLAGILVGTVWNYVATSVFTWGKK